MIVIIITVIITIIIPFIATFPYTTVQMISLLQDGGYVRGFTVGLPLIVVENCCK